MYKVNVSISYELCNHVSLMNDCKLLNFYYEKLTPQHKKTLSKFNHQNDTTNL